MGIFMSKAETVDLDPNQSAATALSCPKCARRLLPAHTVSVPEAIVETTVFNSRFVRCVNPHCNQRVGVMNYQNKLLVEVLDDKIPIYRPLRVEIV